MAALTYEGLADFLLAALVRQQPAGSAPFFVSSTADPFFQTEFPEAIRYAEGRIYKELVLLATRTQNTSLTTIAGSRALNLSNMTPLPVIVPEGFALLVSGGRVPFDFASLDTIDEIWPAESVTLAPNIADFAPRYWAMQDDHTLVMCPTPDTAYAAVVTGLFQPTPLSSANTTTYLSTVYPELLEAACMVFMTGALLKNFGQKADNPQMAMSWEQETAHLMALAKDEEHRRRGLRPNVATAGKAA
jgi:hypothetical protein